MNKAAGAGSPPWHALPMGALDLPAEFSFNCYETRFEVSVVRNGDDGAKLAVRAHLGTLPYSAESALARQYIKAVVQVGENLPYAELTLSRDQAIVVHGTMDFPNHPETAIIVASTSVIAIAVKPMIDIISFFRNAGKSAA